MCSSLWTRHTCDIAIKLDKDTTTALDLQCFEVWLEQLTESDVIDRVIVRFIVRVIVLGAFTSPTNDTLQFRGLTPLSSLNMDVKFGIQIGSVWPTNGTNLGLFKISYRNQNVLKLVLKVPDLSHLGPIGHDRV